MHHLAAHGLPQLGAVANRASDAQKSLHNAIVTINDKGIIQSVDRKTCQLFGYEPDELHGKKVNILIPSPYKEQHDTYIANYLQTNVKKIIDKRRLVEGLHKDGSVFPIMLSVTEVKIWNMRMYIGAIETVQDESAIINTDVNGIITSCNKNVKEMLGYNVTELVGQNIKIVLPAPHAQKHDEYMNNYHQGKKLKVLGQVRNLPIKHKNGVVFPVCVQVKQVVTGGVTAFRGSISHLPKEMVFTIDHRGTILSCNHNFTLPMLGYPHQNLIGKNISMLMPELLLDSEEASETKKRKLNEGGAPTSVLKWLKHGTRQVNLLHADGSSFPVYLEAIRLHPENAAGSGDALYSLQIKRVDTNNGNGPSNDMPSAEMVGEYCLGKVLGRGSYAVVRLGVHRQTNEKVAIKILSKTHLDQHTLQRIKREIDILKQLDHPHICKMIEAIEERDAFNLVMEYCGGGDLLAYMNNGQRGTRISATVHKGELQEVILGPPLHEDDARRIFVQLVSALHHCHSQNVFHRDIKHKNVLFDESGNVKLIDFGLSNWSCPGAMSFCGTPAYAAPEMLLGVQYRGPEVDVWSLGVVLFSLLTGKLPFFNVMDMVVGQLNIPDYISPSCADLLRKMMVVEATQRAVISEIWNHEWVKAYYTPQLVCSSSTLDFVTIPAPSTEPVNPAPPPLLTLSSSDQNSNSFSVLSPLPSSILDESFPSFSEFLNNSDSNTIKQEPPS